MPINSKVIWSEGLFLQPQHLQQQDRYFENLIANRSNLTDLTSWGIIEYELDQNLLLLGKFAYIRCKGVLPDGTMFDTASDGIMPNPIDIPLNAAGRLVYLSLPLKRPNMPEMALAEDDSLFCRYKSENCEVVDNVAGTTNSTDIQIGKITLRSKLDSEDLGGYTCIPIARIKEVLPNKKVQLDNQFIPPCLDIKTVEKLEKFAKELQSLLYQRGERLAQSQTAVGYGGVSEIIDFALLSVINRSEAILQVLIGRKGMHPETFYIYLVELLANLATFNNKTRRPTAIPSYKHHDLQSCFDPLITELRRSLSFVIQHRATLLRLDSRPYGMWVSPIEDRSLLHYAQFVLSVKAEMDADILSAQFPSHTKISGVESIQTLIAHVLPGIDLHHLPTAPREIPLDEGCIYYSFNKNHPYWQDLKASDAIAIHVGNEYPALKLQLWAIRERVDA